MSADFVALRELAAQVEREKTAGTWSLAVFQRLLAQARAAAAGEVQAMEFLLNEFDPAWADGEPLGKDAAFEAQHPRDEDGKFTDKEGDANRVDSGGGPVHTGPMEPKPALKYSYAKTRHESPEDYFYISTGAKENYYTLRHAFVEQVWTKDEAGRAEASARERDYHLQNLSIDREQALAEAERLTGKKFNADFDVRPIGERRDIDWSVFQSGKYAGRSIHEVREQDPGYLLWIAENQRTDSPTYGKTVELIQALMAKELKERGDQREAKAAAERSARETKAAKFLPLANELIGRKGQHANWPLAGWVATELQHAPGWQAWRAGEGRDGAIIVKRDPNGFWAADGGGFVWSVAAGLMNGEVPRGRGLDILVEILAKQAGRRNSNPYNARIEELHAILGSDHK